jgi:hypothetical protein
MIGCLLKIGIDNEDRGLRQPPTLRQIFAGDRPAGMLGGAQKQKKSAHSVKEPISLRRIMPEVQSVATITDDFMRQMISRTKTYSIVILKAGPNRNLPGVEKIIWEHGRRNFSLREDGILSIVCPISDGSEISGVGIFNAGIDEVRSLMEGDPGVREGVFVYEVHECRSFPGDRLPLEFGSPMVGNEKLRG